jgi:dienelactone hydrolase
VDYSDGETVFEGYAAHDATAKGPRPAVLIGHDWSGQSDATRAVAERIARLGYVGFAVDAYGKGVRGSVTGDSSALMNPLMEDRALLRKRLLAGFEAAKRHKAVDATRIAAIGYCFGGLCVLDLARAVPTNLKGVVSFHGNYKPPGIGKQEAISAKVLILHGWRIR